MGSGSRPWGWGVLVPLTIAGILGGLEFIVVTAPSIGAGLAICTLSRLF